jgi:ATP-dependent RNA circularization protein (DNA/RNA ligase family)
MRRKRLEKILTHTKMKKIANEGAVVGDVAKEIIKKIKIRIEKVKAELNIVRLIEIRIKRQNKTQELKKLVELLNLKTVLKVKDVEEVKTIKMNIKKRRLKKNKNPSGGKRS